MRGVRKGKEAMQILSMTYLAGIAIMDVRSREVSSRVLFLGTVAAFLRAAYLLCVEGTTWEAMMFGAVPGVILLLLAVLTKGAGMGDGIVLLQMNFFLLLEHLIAAFAMSMLIMGAFSAVLLLMKKGGKNTRLPYLPFLWLGCLGAMILCK